VNGKPKEVVRLLPLSAPQARMINAALAYYEATEHEDGDGYNDRTMQSVRRIVWTALERAGVEP
jgi:hypothetical protein